MYGATYSTSGWMVYQKWVAAGYLHQGPRSGQIAVGTAGVIFLSILLVTLGEIRESAADSIRRGSQADHFTGIEKLQETEINKFHLHASAWDQ